MSIQITVRLPDEQVHFVDRQVSAGKAPSRAALVSKALARLERHERDMRDLEILRKQPYDEFNDMHAWATGNLPDLDA